MEAHLVGGFNPIEKIFQYSNWSISPENRDENKRYLKPPGHGNHFFFMALWTAQCGAAWCGSMPSNIQSTDLMTFQKDPTNHPNGCCVSSPAQKRSWTWSFASKFTTKKRQKQKTQQGLALMHGRWQMIQMIFLWSYSTKYFVSHVHINVSIKYKQTIYTCASCLQFCLPPTFSAVWSSQPFPGCKSPRSDHLVQLAVPRWRVPRRRPKASNPLETSDRCHMKQL